MSVFEQIAKERSEGVFEQVAKERADIFDEIASERKTEWKTAMDDFAKGSDVFKKYKGLAKDPMKIIEGGIEFASALPGFFTGMVGASQNVIKGFLGGTNDIEELYNIAAEGFEREGAKMPAYNFGHEDTHLVGETFMAPALTIMHGGHKIADKVDDPNVKGAIRFASDILGLVAQGKALHGKGKAKIELPKEAPKLDTTFAKNEINIRRAKEKVAVMDTTGAIQQKPLDKLKRQEEILQMEREGFESETPRSQRAQDAGKAFEKEIPFTEDIVTPEKKRGVFKVKDGEFEKVGEKPRYKGAPEIIEPGKTYDPEYLLRTATKKVGGEFKKGEIEGVKETSLKKEIKDHDGEYGLKITDRTISTTRKIKAQAFVDNLTKPGRPIKSAEESVRAFEKFLDENKSLKGKIELAARLRIQELGGKLEYPEGYKQDPELLRRVKNNEFFKREARRLGIFEEGTFSGKPPISKRPLTSDISQKIGSGRWRDPLNKFKQYLEENPTATQKQIQKATGLNQYEVGNLSTLELSQRPIIEIAKDVNSAFGKRGSIDPSGKLTVEQQAAMMRLKGDIVVIKKNAKKTGKTIEKYLVDLNYDPKVAAILQKNSEDIPKYAKSINLEKQDIPEDYKRFELDLLGGEKKKVQTWDQTEKLSRQYTHDVQKGANLFEKAKSGKLALNTEKIDAMRKINVNAIEGLMKVVKKGDVEQANKSLKNYIDNIGRVTSDTSSEIGRMLNIHKRDVSITRMGKALLKLKDGLNERQFAELQKLNTENPIEVKNFINRLDDPKMSDYFLEYWYNSILSGPPTHGVNLAGNTMWTAYQVPHRALTALIDKPYSAFTGKQRSYFLNEIVPMLGGYKSGFKKGKTASGEMMRTGKISSFEDKWALEMGTSLSAFERSPNKVLRKVGRFITPPTRALRAFDVWANAIGFDGEVRAMARRASNEKGLKGKDREAFEKDFAENLTQEQFDKAHKQAKHGTFMDDPDPFTSTIISARGAPVIGPALRFTVIPFVNTISNLTKRGIEMTPGLGIAKEAISRGMGRGRSTPDVIAKQIEGAIIAVYVMDKVEKGEITGPMPDSHNERQAWYRQKKKPWAIKLGDTWFQYRRYEPFNTAIGSVAIGYERIKEAIQNGEEDKATEIFSDIANGIKWNILDGSYFSGLQSIFSRHDKNITEGAGKFAASWVPYSSFWRSMNRSYEVATEGSASVREGDSWIKAFSQVIPGMSSKMPKKLNVYGDPAVIPGGVFRQWLPYKWSLESNDIVEKELETVGYYPGLPKKKITHRRESIELEDDVYRSYAIDYGQELKKRFKLKVDSVQWDRYSTKRKILSLERIQRRVASSARGRLIKHLKNKGTIRRTP